jgi:ring-1,2-phenylacetyl-CoA epoxidase subunit PaaD
VSVAQIPSSSAGHTGSAELARAHAVLATVADPEIPVLSIVDLGIVRGLSMGADGELAVGLSPTYSGCPATLAIRVAAVEALRAAGYTRVRVYDVLSPPWTSDWISSSGREKLRAYGIAPPPQAVSTPKQLLGDHDAECPRCGSKSTERVSEFGSTPCKSLHRCRDCLEPFDQFKCI